MPIVGLPVEPVTLKTLTDDVVRKVENRESDRLKVETWVRDALIEISSSPGFRNEFDELEETGPVYDLTADQAMYDGALFINPDDVNLAFLDFVLWQDPPYNTNQKQLVQRNYQEIDRHRKTPSIPSSWYRYKNEIGFDPVPNFGFQAQARYYRLHPIDDSCLANTLILLPRDWWEIVVLSATERGWIELLEFEKATAIHMLLYGDPKEPMRPGLIAGRIKRREKEDWRKERKLAPIKRRYSYSGR